MKYPHDMMEVTIDRNRVRSSKGDIDAFVKYFDTTDLSERDDEFIRTMSKIFYKKIDF